MSVEISMTTWQSSWEVAPAETLGQEISAAWAHKALLTQRTRFQLFNSEESIKGAAQRHKSFSFTCFAISNPLVVNCTSHLLFFPPLASLHISPVRKISYLTGNPSSFHALNKPLKSSMKDLQESGKQSLKTRIWQFLCKEACFITAWWGWGWGLDSV